MSQFPRLIAELGESVRLPVWPQLAQGSLSRAKKKTEGKGAPVTIWNIFKETGVNPGLSQMQ